MEKHEYLQFEYICIILFVGAWQNSNQWIFSFGSTSDDIDLELLQKSFLGYNQYHGGTFGPKNDNSTWKN